MDFGNILKNAGKTLGMGALTGGGMVMNLLAKPFGKANSPQEALYQSNQVPQQQNPAVNSSFLNSGGVKDITNRQPLNFQQNAVQAINDRINPQPRPSLLEEIQNLMVSKTSQPAVMGQTAQAPTPTGIPQGINRIEPYPTGPQTPDRNELYPKLRTQEAVIQPNVFDSIMKYIQDDYQRRLAMALAYQESTGGLSPVGDEGKSFGPYHIMPGNAPWSEFGSSSNINEQQARDPAYATQFLKGVMDNQLAAGKQPFEQVLRWNANSGYQKDKGLVDDNGVPYTQNLGPRYDEDIPRFATMAAFLRGN